MRRNVILKKIHSYIPPGYRLTSDSEYWSVGSNNFVRINPTTLEEPAIIFIDPKTLYEIADLEQPIKKKYKRNN